MIKLSKTPIPTWSIEKLRELCNEHKIELQVRPDSLGVTLKYPDVLGDETFFFAHTSSATAWIEGATRMRTTLLRQARQEELKRINEQQYKVMVLKTGSLFWLVSPDGTKLQHKSLPAFSCGAAIAVATDLFNRFYYLGMAETPEPSTTGQS